MCDTQNMNDGHAWTLDSNVAFCTKHTKQVEVLRRDVSQYKARIESLEADFMRVDVGSHAGPGTDEQLGKAWEVAQTFKKRWAAQGCGGGSGFWATCGL